MGVTEPQACKQAEHKPLLHPQSSGQPIQPGPSGNGMEGACPQLKNYGGKMVTRLSFLPFFFKPKEGVYRGLPSPRKVGLSGTGMTLSGRCGGHRGAAVGWKD